MSASNELSNRERNFPLLAGRLLPTSRGENGEKAFFCPLLSQLSRRKISFSSPLLGDDTEHELRLPFSSFKTNCKVSKDTYPKLTLQTDQ